MRTDSQIEQDVNDELTGDPEVVTAGITVRVEGGAARLAGSTPTYAAKLATLRAVERVSGVRSVVDDMTVVPPPHLDRSDVAIGRAIAVAFGLNVQVPHEAISVFVIGGWVTLVGIVRTQADRCTAEATVALLAGVRGIVNRLTVDPPEAVDKSIVQGIERAFHRSAELDCKHILVEAAPDGEVQLRGTVRSWAELHDAERAAWSAPGVRGVVNRLAVV
jgi:osmotically-inducible protein OsmY